MFILIIDVTSLIMRRLNVVVEYKYTRFHSLIIGSGEQRRDCRGVNRHDLPYKSHRAEAQSALENTRINRSLSTSLFIRT